MSRIALIYQCDGGHPEIVTDDPLLEVYGVDEQRPDDRVYRLGPGVDHVSPHEFDKLIAGEVHQLGDKPIVEQAVRALLDRHADGKPQLFVIPPDDNKRSS